jgi:hypothetical protein
MLIHLWRIFPSLILPYLNTTYAWLKFIPSFPIYIKTLKYYFCTAIKVKETFYSIQLVMLFLSSNLLPEDFEIKKYRTIILPAVYDVSHINRRKLHNGKLHHLYSLTNIIRIINSSRVRWVGHEAYMEEKSLQFFRKI